MTALTGRMRHLGKLRQVIVRKNTRADTRPNKPREGGVSEKPQISRPATQTARGVAEAAWL